MKSLRALLSALLSMLNALVARVRGELPTHPRPARGPAHPWAYAHAKWRRTERQHRAPSLDGGHLGAARAHAPRPARIAPPAHILALLASAPDVEPEFARRPRPTLAAPFRRLAAHVRVYNPRPTPAQGRARAPAVVVVIPDRIARVLDPITRWIVTASPARRVRKGAIA